jgi:hypothetical protein
MKGKPGTTSTLLREHWRELGFWHWLWDEHVPLGAKLLAAGALVAGLGTGGIVAAGALSSNAPAASYVVRTTIVRTTVRVTHGKPVVDKVQVVRTVHLKPHTVTDVHSVRVPGAPGPTRIETVVKKVPEVTKQTVTVHGKPKVETKVHWRTKTVTTKQVVTNQQTVTDQKPGSPGQTVTAVHTVTQPGKTRTETSVVTTTVTQTQTQTQTQTETQTITQTQTVTNTETETDTVTVTTTTGLLGG